ncbi:MAG: hypothetical protein IT165_15175 [Bryobacterales bacterium]|nr:hypothetical protein [Bryobacterales bacterium]
MRRSCFLLLLAVALLLAGADDQAWKGKKVADWTQDDCRQLLSDSPWAKTVTPAVERPASAQRRPGGMGRGGFGMPGMGGMGRRGGMGGGGRARRPGGMGQQGAPPMLYLRWESALPIREAELKTRDTNAPTLDEEHYAIAVYNLPNRMNGDSKSLAGQLRKQASIKRDGKKALKPSSVEVLQREDGPVVVYLFPRTQEITKQDERLEFDARIGALHLTESFFVEDMVYEGKLEL